LVGLGKPKELTDLDLEAAGGSITENLASSGEREVTLMVDQMTGFAQAAPGRAARYALGALLRAYRFDRYKTKQKPEDKPSLDKVTVMVGDPAAARRAFADMEKVADGVFFTRDLVSEPANVIFPKSLSVEAKKLTKLGVRVQVLGVAEMRKLGMGALLGVGQGSAHESQLLVMRWDGTGAKGKGKAAQPIAFVGKGVTFDTGGISIKPAQGMEDMKGDMAGAATVVGLMHALAERAAKVNAIGIIGLVENMPDGQAQRPGDIVTSLSGQTIEIINTDAEGRLVLGDLLWYVQDKYQPQFMINLATLTGAILVALGQEHAGLFSNNDALAEKLANAGKNSGEKVWRMPLGKEYDKQIDSKFADMKNTGGRNAGSITAAQFLQRFVNETPWAHLDIAGTAMASPASDINRSWASGWGVQLLDALVAANYEK